MRELHAEDRVARLEQRHVDGVVRLCAGVRLHVRVLGAEERLGAIDRELLRDVDPLAAAVVALARQPLRVLVREHRAGRLEDRPRDEVLRSDHLERVLLSLELALDHLRDLRIDRGQRLGEVGGVQVAHRTVNINLLLLLRRRPSRARRPPPAGGASSARRGSRAASRRRPSGSRRRRSRARARRRSRSPRVRSACAAAAASGPARWDSGRRCAPGARVRAV